MHFKMLALGLFGLFLTFRREIHDYARIEDQNDKEEEEADLAAGLEPPFPYVMARFDAGYFEV